MIREAQLSDLAAIVKLETDSFEFDTFHKRQLRYLLTQAKAKTHVCVRDNTVVGYSIVLLPMHPKPARVYSLAVSKSYQNQQIGQALLNAVQDSAKKLGYKKLILEVRTDAIYAIKLYKKLGFSIDKAIDNYYEDGMSAYKLSMAL